MVELVHCCDYRKSLSFSLSVSLSLSLCTDVLPIKPSWKCFESSYRSSFEDSLKQIDLGQVRHGPWDLTSGLFLGFKLRATQEFKQIYDSVEAEKATGRSSSAWKAKKRSASKHSQLAPSVSSIACLPLSAAQNHCFTGTQWRTPWLPPPKQITWLPEPEFAYSCMFVSTPD